ncbi:branched-chain amino acid ABC transporter permease [Pelodictyon phaeoclathratiforme]|nr:branched-chain amino acid ABC transporter permease [Pelodictyon phaeoclathratiforme]
MLAQICFNILVSFSIYLLISTSFSIIYNSVKFFHFAHGAIISLGAYFSYFFYLQLNLPLFIAIPFTVFLSIFVSLLIELLIYRPLKRRKVSSLSLLIVSLGIYIVLQNVISLIWSDGVKSIVKNEIETGTEIFGAHITNIQIVTIGLSCIIFLIKMLFLQFHKIGRNIRAISTNTELANIMGINSNRIILWSFAIGSGIASIIGVLVAADTGLTPTMGFSLLLYGVVVMIISGIGSNWGLIGGALLLATIQHLTAFFLDGKWIDAITYSILILFLIWKPLGFSGKRLKKTEI